MNDHGSKWIRPEKRLAIYARDGHRCVYCGVRRVRPDDVDPFKIGVEYAMTFTLDHLLPRELGGSNDATNLVSACFSCNSARQDCTLRAWFKKLRAKGVDTDKVAARIRRLVKKPLVVERRSVRRAA